MMIADLLLFCIVHRTFRQRLQRIPRDLFSFIYVKIVTFNIFPARNFSQHFDRNTITTLGIWSTRLHLILIVISFIFLGLHTIVRPETLRKTYSKPSFSIYTSLAKEYGDNAVECLCSSISSSYGDLVTIEPSFHQICYSSFVDDQWRINVSRNLLMNIERYAATDYRRFLSAHLLFLNKLCELSIQSVNYSTIQLLSSILVTKQLLSKPLFQHEVDATLKQSQASTTGMLSIHFSLLRSTGHANAIISMYGTNFEYVDSGLQTARSRLNSRASIYDGNCSCAVNATCTIPASYTSKNETEMVSLLGLRMGCTPTESLLVSTLECFYNLSCIHLIMQMVHDSDQYLPIPSPLNIEDSRFPIKTTVSDLLDHLFIEKWTVIYNYSSYFHRCAPAYCFYTYRQQLDSLYTATYLISVYGGLSIISRLLCPRILNLLTKFYYLYKRRAYPTAPSRTLATSTCGTLEL